MTARKATCEKRLRPACGCADAMSCWRSSEEDSEAKLLLGAAARPTSSNLVWTADLWGEKGVLVHMQDGREEVAMGTVAGCSSAACGNLLSQNAFLHAHMAHSFQGVLPAAAARLQRPW